MRQNHLTAKKYDTGSIVSKNENAITSKTEKNGRKKKSKVVNL